MDWRCKAALTAVAIVLLLAAAQRLGRHMAGILTGLPTVTGPALAWLAFEHGEFYAVDAAIGSVAACAACAVFALAYERASRRTGPYVADRRLGRHRPRHRRIAMDCRHLLASLATAVGASLVIHAALAGRGDRARSTAVRLRGEPWVTAGVAGLVSGAVSVLAISVGSFWAGMMASPPLIAAAMAMHEHLRREHQDVRDFLRGYVGGLIGRGGYGAVFALLVGPSVSGQRRRCAALADAPSRTPRCACSRRSAGPTGVRARFRRAKRDDGNCPASARCRSDTDSYAPERWCRSPLHCPCGTATLWAGGFRERPLSSPGI